MELHSTVKLKWSSIPLLTSNGPPFHCEAIVLPYLDPNPYYMLTLSVVWCNILFLSVGESKELVGIWPGVINEVIITVIIRRLVRDGRLIARRTVALLGIVALIITAGRGYERDDLLVNQTADGS